MKWKSTLFATVLGALVMFGGAGAANAQDRYRDRDRDDACYRKMQREERDLYRAIERHGYYSRQADDERREIAKLRAKCGFNRDRDDRWRR